MSYVQRVWISIFFLLFLIFLNKASRMHIFIACNLNLSKPWVKPFSTEEKCGARINDASAADWNMSPGLIWY